MKIVFDRLVHQTELAWLLAIDDIKQWVPKSVGAELDEEENTIELPSWFVKCNALEEYVEE